MRKLFLFFAATGAGLFSLFTPRDAHALGPLDIEIAGKAGYGTNPDSGLGFNPLGVGLGGRAGLSIFGLYAGVNVVDYLGGSQPCPPVMATGACPNVSAHTLMYGGEFGYGFKISIITIRPQIGVGSALVSGSTSNSTLYLEPGVTGLVAFGILIVGVDANLAIFPGSNQINSNGTTSTTVTEAFTIHGQVGVRF
jgi:hypothetical protein